MMLAMILSYYKTPNNVHWNVWNVTAVHREVFGKPWTACAENGDVGSIARKGKELGVGVGVGGEEGTGSVSNNIDSDDDDDKQWRR